MIAPALDIDAFGSLIDELLRTVIIAAARRISRVADAHRNVGQGSARAMGAHQAFAGRSQIRSASRARHRARHRHPRSRSAAFAENRRAHWRCGASCARPLFPDDARWPNSPTSQATWPSATAPRAPPNFATRSRPVASLQSRFWSFSTRSVTCAECATITWFGAQIHGALKILCNITNSEECRVPVGRPDFKSGRGCQQSLVGSTPILFRRTTASAERWPPRAPQPISGVLLNNELDQLATDCLVRP